MYANVLDTKATTSPHYSGGTYDIDNATSNPEYLQQGTQISLETKRLVAFLEEFQPSVSKFKIVTNMLRSGMATTATFSSQSVVSVDEILTQLEFAIHLPIATKSIQANVQIIGWGKPTAVNDKDIESFVE